MAVVLGGIKLFPNTGRVDVFITFVPPPVDDFCKRWIVISALEIRHGRRFDFLGSSWSGQRVVCFWIRRICGHILWCMLRWLSRVSKERPTWTTDFVDKKVVKVIML